MKKFQLSKTLHHIKSFNFGCLTNTAITSGLIVFLFIIGSALVSGGMMYSPGALNAVSGNAIGGVSSHAAIAGDCKACHTAPWEKATMDDRCSSCHKDVVAQLTDPASKHGRMMQVNQNAKCRDCHPEHQGESGLLTVLKQWTFPHDLTGYSLKGHQLKAGNDPFSCADCHGADVTKFASVTCAKCHVQKDMAFMVDHMVTFGDTCLGCHDGVDKFGKNFNHKKFAFTLTGKHTAVTCLQCHPNARTTADLQAAKQECVSCHQGVDPHKGKLGADCASCHSTDGWKPSSFNHVRSAFKLNGAHIKVECSKCHLNSEFKGTPQDCVACHKKDDNHKGQLGMDCALCHATSAWKDVTFDHNTAAFKLTGLHNKVSCAACHVNGVFKGTPTDCYACHAAKDTHNGQFGRTCSTCHNTSGWQNVSFDHAGTAFPLKGLHLDVACKSCHVNGVYKNTPKNCYACHASKDAHNGQYGQDCGSCHNPGGWKNVSFDHSQSAFSLTGTHTTVACALCHVNGVFKGTPKDCYSCHAAKDNHNGQFGTNCGSCHKPTKWLDVFYDHSGTAFPLVDSHTTVACSACHVNGIYKGTPTDCYSCHAAKDNHKGQFGTNCGSCHKPTKWLDVFYDHSGTAFPLVGSHTTVTCSACHVNGIYKGTPTNCYACHAAKDNHNGKFGTSCELCHKPTKWQDVVFDHSVTAFPLVDTHTTVACLSCHLNGVFQGTPKDCYACHAAKDHHNGQFGTSCGVCHKPTKWSDVSFDHSSTAFPLVGKHAPVACASCHVNGVYKGTPTDCYACHAAKDNHNGQLGTNCARCHTPMGWNIVVFDHNTTIFPLTGKHLQLVCANCHPSGQYVIPTACVSCHAEPTFHAGAFGTLCEQCHTTSGWLPAVFVGPHPKHNGQTMLNHHKATCRTCHPDTVTVWTCLACHKTNNP
jgi:hypothetical protein